MADHSSSHNLKKPEKGKKPKKITTKNSPGGPQTPGAKARAEAQTTDSNN